MLSVSNFTANVEQQHTNTPNIPDMVYWKAQLSVIREKIVKSCFCSSQQFDTESTWRPLDFQSLLSKNHNLSNKQYCGIFDKCNWVWLRWSWFASWQPVRWCGLDMWLKQCWEHTRILLLWSSACTALSFSILPILLLQWVRLGHTRVWGWTQPKWPNLILYNIMLSMMLRMLGHLWIHHLFFQVTVSHAEALVFKMWLDICMLMGSSEWILLCLQAQLCSTY